MTELSFAKSFLTTLDSKPTKISADHVEDPKNYPGRGAYILPKMARPLPKKQKLAPGQERSLTVTMKSLRNPPLDITLAAQPLSTSILSLKEAITSKTSIPIAKLKILYQKKPAPDSKILKDILEEDVGNKVEFSIMVIGGAAAIKGKYGEEIEPKLAGDTGGSGILQTEQFWGDLRGFLLQRLKDETEADRVTGIFKKSIHS